MNNNYKPPSSALEKPRVEDAFTPVERWILLTIAVFYIGFGALEWPHYTANSAVHGIPLFVTALITAITAVSSRFMGVARGAFFLIIGFLAMQGILILDQHWNTALFTFVICVPAVAGICILHSYED